MAGRTGRPPLTERHRAAIRLEIAREALRLFTAQGVAATSADEIAAAVGISTRTLWRYFPSKESCVRPMLTVGITATARCLRAWQPGRPLSGVLDRVLPDGAGHSRSGDTAERADGTHIPAGPDIGWTPDVLDAAVTPADPNTTEALDALDASDLHGISEADILALIRLTRSEPGLRAVWLQTHHDAEPLFARVLAGRATAAGRPADELTCQVQAAMINGALRAAVEHLAWHPTASREGLAPLLRAALLTAARGLPD